MIVQRPGDGLEPDGDWETEARSCPSCGATLPPFNEDPDLVEDRYFASGFRSGVGRVRRALEAAGDTLSRQRILEIVDEVTR